jgi:hypothetical protein
MARFYVEDLTFAHRVFGAHEQRTITWYMFWQFTGRWAEFQIPRRQIRKESL